MQLATSSTSEVPRDFGFLISELPGQQSRAQGILKALNDAATIYNAGRVLGQITVPTLTVAVGGGNTGNATIAAGAAINAPIAGVYTATCVTATTATLTDPNGKTLGTVTFGTAWSNTLGGIAFTITAGGTACIAGDSFTITVPATSGQWVTLAVSTVTDGSQNAAGILGMRTDVSTTLAPGAPIINRGAEVKDLRLDWGSLNQGNIDKAIIALAALGILVRTTGV